MSGKLFILSGASGSGKTTLLNSMCENHTSGGSIAPKYSERKYRGAGDDIIHVEEIDSEEFDLAYIINGKKYGVKTKEISDLVDKGCYLYIVISDFRVVRQLKKLLGKRAISIYISSTVNEYSLMKIHGDRHVFDPTKKQKEILSLQFSRLSSAVRLSLWPSVFECMGELLEDWRNFIPDGKSMEIRAEKIRLFHNRYVDNIDLFDHVVLNYQIGNPQEMTMQMEKLIEYYKTDASMENSTLASPPLFVVAAASGAGKGMLMETLNTIGKSRVRTLKKLGKRPAKENDRRDGMEAIGENGVFPTDFDLQWRFHKGANWGGTEYAISSKEIEENIASGRPQIVISNMQQFDMFKNKYDNVIFIYLHGLYSDQDIEKYQYDRCETREEATQRIKEISQVYKDYMKNIHYFRHVLLNTTHPEDLFDQMFKLIEHYDES